MPAKSKAQLRLMYAAMHSAEVRKRTGISRAVAKEFTGATHSTKGMPEHKKRKGKATRALHG